MKRIIRKILMAWRQAKWHRHMFYSVTIWEPEAEFEPWTSVFTTRKKAEEFKKKAEKMIRNSAEEKIVTIDSGSINEDSYLDCLEAACCEE